MKITIAELRRLITEAVVDASDRFAQQRAKVNLSRVWGSDQATMVTALVAVFTQGTDASYIHDDDETVVIDLSDETQLYVTGDGTVILSLNGPETRPTSAAELFKQLADPRYQRTRADHEMKLRVADDDAHNQQRDKQRLADQGPARDYTVTIVNIDGSEPDSQITISNATVPELESEIDEINTLYRGKFKVTKIDPPPLRQVK